MNELREKIIIALATIDTYPTVDKYLKAKILNSVYFGTIEEQEDGLRKTYAETKSLARVAKLNGYKS